MKKRWLLIFTTPHTTSREPKLTAVLDYSDMPLPGSGSDGWGIPDLRLPDVRNAHRCYTQFVKLSNSDFVHYLISDIFFEESSFAWIFLWC